MLTTSSKPSQDGDHLEDLPDALQDFLQLHSSFLTSLSLHFAHHGIQTPADVRLLTPTIQASWGRRKVELHDIRQILGVLQSLVDPTRKEETVQPAIQPVSLSLSDYGKGKICIEVSESDGSGCIAREALDQDVFDTRFERNLRRLWHEAVQRSNVTREKDATTENSSRASPSPTIEQDVVKAFLKDLPLATITPCSSLMHLQASKNSSRKRREDFNTASDAKKRTLSDSKGAPNQSDKTSMIRRTDLLARVSKTINPDKNTSSDEAPRSELKGFQEPLKPPSHPNRSSTADQP